MFGSDELRLIGITGVVLRAGACWLAVRCSVDEVAAWCLSEWSQHEADG